MCEIMEKYNQIAAKEAAIKTTVITSFEFNASKEKIIELLMKNFALSEQEAIKQYEQYAPVMM